MEEICREVSGGDQGRTPMAGLTETARASITNVHEGVGVCDPRITHPFSVVR